MTTRRTMLGALLALASGCSGADDDAIETLHARVVNGEIDTTHRSVVAVVLTDGQRTGLCSGTVIHVDPLEKLGIVLTAAHCFDAGEPVAVIAGDDAATSTEVYRVIDHVAHPEWSGAAKDVALVRIVGVTESTARTPVVDPLDDPLALGVGATLLGYGRTEPGPQPDQNSLRRSLAMTVQALTPDVATFTGLGNVCQGDSGGPALALVGGDERVVAVTSRVDASCFLDADAARTSAVHDDFIAPYLDQSVPQTCDRCWRTLRSNDGECVPSADACVDDADCRAILDCREACADPACEDDCVAPSTPGLDLFLERGRCVCDRCPACESDDFCSAIARVEARLHANLDAGRRDASSVDARSRPVSDEPSSDAGPRSDATPSPASPSDSGCGCRATKDAPTGRGCALLTLAVLGGIRHRRWRRPFRR